MINFRTTYIYNLKTRNIYCAFAPGFETLACESLKYLVSKMGDEVGLATRDGKRLTVGDKLPTQLISAKVVTEQRIEENQK